MNSDPSFWIAILGAVTGAIGMATGIASMVYTRRQAIAAEGPSHPDIEIAEHGWDSSADWYRIEIVTRNLTPKSWKMTGARVKSPTGSKLVSSHYISYIDTGGSYRAKDRNDVDPSVLPSVAHCSTAVAPSGTKGIPNFIGTSDAWRETFFLHMPGGSSRKFFSIVFTLEDKAAIARHKNIELKRTLAPRTINAAE